MGHSASGLPPEPRIQPYQILFPIGCLYATLGVAVWTLHGLGLLPKYPGTYHADWMIGGFLLSFSAGFLMTALPRFTGALGCGMGELTLASALALLQIAHVGFTAALFAFLLAFAMRRFFRRRYAPPPHFVFVGLGLLLGVGGSVGIALFREGLAPTLPFRAIQVFYFQGVLLCFCVGIGARLVRVLLGYEPSPLVQISRPGKAGAGNPFPSEALWKVFGSFGLMLVGFALELVPEFATPGRILRALAVSWIAFSAWNLHRLPKRRGALAWGLWFACWWITLGVWAFAVFPGWEVHSAHVLFIGGFGTLAIMVGSRVMLAHGGYSLSGEVRSIPLRTAWVLLLLAMGSRVGAPFSPTYMNHLIYAGALAGLAFFVWGIWMIRHLGPASRPSVIPGDRPRAEC